MDEMPDPGSAGERRLLRLPAFPPLTLGGLCLFECLDDVGRDTAPVGELEAVLPRPLADGPGLLTAGGGAGAGRLGAPGVPLDAATGTPGGLDELSECVAEVLRVG